MVTIFDTNPERSINKIAESLKDKIQQPEWTKFVKTGAGKERPPIAEDWFFKRAASILRTVYIRGPVGIGKLRVKYGNKKNRGHKPEKFYKASGKIIRNVLQQLEKANLVQYKKEGVHKGRIVTSKGRSFVDKCAVK